MTDRNRIVLVGAASIGAYVGKMLSEYQRDAEQTIVIKDPPKLPDFGFPEMSRGERRAYGSKKLKLKGLRP